MVGILFVGRLPNPLHAIHCSIASTGSIDEAVHHVLILITCAGRTPCTVQNCIIEYKEARPSQAHSFNDKTAMDTVQFGLAYCVASSQS